jgi:hypothetical protein
MEHLSIGRVRFCTLHSATKTDGIMRTFILLLAAMLLPVVVTLAGDAYARRR